MTKADLGPHSRRKSPGCSSARLARQVFAEQKPGTLMSAYSKAIREELLANGGHGAARYLVDDKTGSSLRTY